MAAFVLTQLKPAPPSTKPLSLVLQGPASPLDKAQIMAVEQAIDITNRRNGTRHVQVKGPIELPTTLNFLFDGRDIHAGNRHAVRNSEAEGIGPFEIVETLGDFVRQGIPVRVSIYTIDQVAIVTRVVPTIGMFERWNVSIELEWLAPPLIVAQFAALDATRPPTTAGVEDLAAEWNQDMANLREPIAVAIGDIEKVQGYIREANVAVTNARRVIAEAVNFRDGLARVALGVQASLRNVAGATEDLANFVSKPLGEYGDTGNFVDIFERAAYRIGILRPATKMAHASTLEGWYNSNTDSQNTYTAAEGETIYSVAWRAYGDTRFAQALAEYNGLKNYTLKGGMVIILPPEKELTGA